MHRYFQIVGGFLALAAFGKAGLFLQSSEVAARAIGGRDLILQAPNWVVLCGLCVAELVTAVLLFSKLDSYWKHLVAGWLFGGFLLYHWTLLAFYGSNNCQCMGLLTKLLRVSDQLANFGTQCLCIAVVAISVVAVFAEMRRESVAAQAA